MASEASTSYSVVLESKPNAIIEVCKQILSKLETNNFSEEDIFSVHLALEEAFLNAIRHGNKMDPNKGVKIAYSIDSDKAEITMVDEGDGFDPEAIPDPRYGENLYKAYGRGLLLIHSYMDAVKFSERGSCLNMVKYKKKAHPTENQTQAKA
ncbi:MAG: ATP-binding protein [Planctomycetes bacterium]|nr:ATP-binding protein [Planctomycetota bacterium]